MKNPLPSVSQIREVKHLHSTRLFGPATIAKLTGVRLRDVFRIKNAMFPTVEVSRNYSPILTVTPGGKILSGLHRSLAARQNGRSIRIVVDNTAE